CHREHAANCRSHHRTHPQPPTRSEGPTPAHVPRCPAPVRVWRGTHAHLPECPPSRTEPHRWSRPSADRVSYPPGWPVHHGQVLRILPPGSCPPSRAVRTIAALRRPTRRLSSADRSRRSSASCPRGRPALRPRRAPPGPSRLDGPTANCSGNVEGLARRCPARSLPCAACSCARPASGRTDIGGLVVRPFASWFGKTRQNDSRSRKKPRRSLATDCGHMLLSYLIPGGSRLMLSHIIRVVSPL